MLRRWASPWSGLSGGERLPRSAHRAKCVELAGADELARLERGQQTRDLVEAVARRKSAGPAGEGLVELPERAAGRSGVGQVRVVVDVGPEGDEQAIVPVRAGIDPGRRRCDGRAGAFEEARELDLGTKPPRPTQPRKRQRHARDNGRGGEVHEQIRQVAQHPRVAGRQAMRTGGGGRGCERRGRVDELHRLADR
jgi:hypothetical protein